MTPEQAVERLTSSWPTPGWCRTFLKHADEIQDDEDLLDVPRTIFDYIRATEPAAQSGDAREFLHRIRGKLPKSAPRGRVLRRQLPAGLGPHQFPDGGPIALRLRPANRGNPGSDRETGLNDFGERGRSAPCFRMLEQGSNAPRSLIGDPGLVQGGNCLLESSEIAAAFEGQEWHFGRGQQLPRSACAT